MNPEQHLAHLFQLMAAPFTYHWWAYVKARAAKLAERDPECAQLPAMVEQEYKRLRSLSTSPAAKD